MNSVSHAAVSSSRHVPPSTAPAQKTASPAKPPAQSTGPAQHARRGQKLDLTV